MAKTRKNRTLLDLIQDMLADLERLLRPQPEPAPVPIPVRVPKETRR